MKRIGVVGVGLTNEQGVDIINRDNFSEYLPTTYDVLEQKELSHRTCVRQRRAPIDNQLYGLATSRQS